MLLTCYQKPTWDIRGALFTVTWGPIIIHCGEFCSVVEQVLGETREAELARMATGKLDTNAGTDLAKALLDEFGTSQKLSERR